MKKWIILILGLLSIQISVKENCSESPDEVKKYDDACWKKSGWKYLGIEKANYSGKTVDLCVYTSEKCENFNCESQKKGIKLSVFRKESVNLSQFFIQIDSTAYSDGMFYLRESNTLTQISRKITSRTVQPDSWDNYLFLNEFGEKIGGYSIHLPKDRTYTSEKKLYPYFSHVSGDTVFNNMEYFRKQKAREEKMKKELCEQDSSNCDSDFFSLTDESFKKYIQSLCICFT